MTQLCIPVTESSQPAAARRAVTTLAEAAELDEQATGSLALLVTELATNLVKHAIDGQLLMRRLGADGEGGVEVLSLDKGPGIADVAKALSDGYSTAGSPGNGMGALIRTASEFDLYSQADKGTAIVVRVLAKSRRASTPWTPSIGVVHQPKHGEPAVGDDWTLRSSSDGWICAVADGLGHGLHASEAAKAAIESVWSGRCDRTPIELVAAAHEATKPTRGAAFAIAMRDRRNGAVRFAGLGNISAVILDREARRHLISSNGVLGHERGKVREYSQPWSAQSVLLLHTDGIATRWDMEQYPGLLSRDPSLIAGVMYRDHVRGYDDATVVVIKEKC